MNVTRIKKFKDDVYFLSKKQNTELEDKLCHFILMQSLCRTSGRQIS